MNRHVMSSCLTLAFALIATLPVQAALDVRVLSTTIPQNGTAFLDVVISGDGDLLRDYLVGLNITPLVGPTGGSSLQFVAIQPHPQLNDPAVAPSYVFNGVSVNFDFLVDNAPPPPIYGVSDRASSNVPVTVDRLLTRIQLQHLAGATDAGNDVYLVDTFFSSFNFVDGVEIVPVPFAFTPGTVTVEATAVPEPSSIALLSLLAGGSVFYKRRRAKKLAMAV